MVLRPHIQVAALEALEALRDSWWAAFSMVAESRSSSSNNNSRRVTHPVADS